MAARGGSEVVANDLHLHHAMAVHASGFSVYNDVAIAIAWLLG